MEAMLGDAKRKGLMRIQTGAAALQRTILSDLERFARGEGRISFDLFTKGDFGMDIRPRVSIRATTRVLTADDLERVRQFARAISEQMAANRTTLARCRGRITISADLQSPDFDIRFDLQG
jgi:hypothetical protein